MKAQYENRGDLDRVQPGQFQESAGGSRVFFIEKNLLSQNTASNVFIATTENGKETVTSARRGRTEIIGNDRFLILENGQRLENSIGKSDLRISEFGYYSIRIEQDLLGSKLDNQLNTRSIIELLRNPTPPNWGEISWRIGFVLAAFNLMVIALAATRINPRIGKSSNLFFSLLLFQVYLNFLGLGQNWISTGQIGFAAFNLLLHGGVLAASVYWLAKRQYNWRLGRILKRATPTQSKVNG
jgi:lipopolysaccharide export system permease protein